MAKCQVINRIRRLAVRPWFGFRFRRPLTLLQLTPASPQTNPQPGSAYARFRLPCPTSPENSVTFLRLTTRFTHRPSDSTIHSGRTNVVSTLTPNIHRQAADQHERTRLLQHQKAGCRRRLAPTHPVSVDVPKVSVNCCKTTRLITCGWQMADTLPALS